MRTENEYYVDENNNKWDMEIFSKKEADECSETLVNCNNCYDCSYCKNCNDCNNCNDCYFCKNCYDCYFCKNCYDCKNKER